MISSVLPSSSPSLTRFNFHIINSERGRYTLRSDWKRIKLIQVEAAPSFTIEVAQIDGLLGCGTQHRFEDFGCLASLGGR